MSLRAEFFGSMSQVSAPEGLGFKLWGARVFGFRLLCLCVRRQGSAAYLAPYTLNPQNTNFQEIPRIDPCLEIPFLVPVPVWNSEILAEIEYPHWDPAYPPLLRVVPRGMEYKECLLSLNLNPEP